jgi:phage tail-like protein
MPQPGTQPVYFRAFQFLVEIDGIIGARFQEAGGVDVTVEVIEYREGGDRTFVRKLPGMTKHGNLTLKRGFTSDQALWDWFKATLDGNEKIRRNLSIVQLDMVGTEVMRWNLFNAFPVKYTAQAFNAKTNELAIESVEIAYERLDRA